MMAGHTRNKARALASSGKRMINQQQKTIGNFEYSGHVELRDNLSRGIPMSNQLSNP